LTLRREVRIHGAVMGIGLRAWLAGLLVGLFALAAVAVPGQHTRMLLDRATLELAYAMPDGTLPMLCAAEDGSDVPHGHAVSPDCLACLLMAAPGIAPAPLPEPARIAAATDAGLAGHTALARLDLAFPGQLARAPPLPSIL
jgi:hypothetical protein